MTVTHLIDLLKLVPHPDTPIYVRQYGGERETQSMEIIRIQAVDPVLQTPYAELVVRKDE